LIWEYGVALRYWWVNQNQTFRQEIAGGYLWSPKRNANGGRNPFYETMREVSPGDLIFSFVDTKVAAIGIAKSYCWESPKPTEFGAVGQNWENIGWRVNVSFVHLLNKVRPKDHMAVLKAVLPDRYSPLQQNGNGIQSIYLTELSLDFTEVLSGLIGEEARQMLTVASTGTPIGNGRIATADDLDVWEHRLEEQVETDSSVNETEREAIVRARRGQGLFKQRVMEIETRCRITGVSNPSHLLASHCKPWRDSSNEERLNGENGLLLTPSIDHLFDRGFIGFDDAGELIISPVAHRPSLQKMGVETNSLVNVGAFTEGQRQFLDYHRNAVLLRIAR
jgi:putative restriction endonuclease